MQKNWVLTVALATLIWLPAPAAAGEDLPLGARGPEFRLRGTDGEMHALVDLAGEVGTTIIFTCNNCPYSQAYEERIIALAHRYAEEGFSMVAINPSAAGSVPEESLEEMVKRAAEKSYPFPYLADETQAVARAYGARVTPHGFLLDAKGLLVYRGRIDSSVRSEDVRQSELIMAMEALLTGEEVPVPETRAFGCGIQWASGQESD